MDVKSAIHNTLFFGAGPAAATVFVLLLGIDAMTTFPWMLLWVPIALACLPLAHLVSFIIMVPLTYILAPVNALIGSFLEAPFALMDYRWRKR